jgi:hypothetical protein
MKAYLFFDNGLPQITAFIAETIKKHGHEIEILEGAKTLSIHITCDAYHPGDLPFLKVIPIPRPKKKVKKWRWYIVEEDDVTTNRYTLREATEAFGCNIELIINSEREVEE